MELVALLLKSILEYGAIGLLAAAGWSLAGWFLWRDFKRKGEVSVKLSAKEALIAQKDKEVLQAKQEIADKIEKLSDERVKDLKEVIEDYNMLANSTIHTLDKLTAALNVTHRIDYK